MFFQIYGETAGWQLSLIHIWCPPHDWYESIVASEGLELAYDGLQIEI